MSRARRDKKVLKKLLTSVMLDRLRRLLAERFAVQDADAFFGVPGPRPLGIYHADFPVTQLEVSAPIDLEELQRRNVARHG